eukprot:scaffold7859_cov149-Skeletonema_marinoi.AAC.2
MLESPKQFSFRGAFISHGHGRKAEEEGYKEGNLHCVDCREVARVFTGCKLKMPIVQAVPAKTE